MESVYVKDKAHEERVEAMQLLIERHNIAMSRMVDATIGVMVAHAIPVFNETREELFDGFHRRFSGYVCQAARFLDEYLESYEFEYVEQNSEIRRQSGEYREAVKMLAAGSVGAAFEKLDGMGWIKEDGLTADYLAAIDAGCSVLVVCPTHAEGREITAQLRDTLREAGKIGRVDHEFDTLANLNLTEAELVEAKKERPDGVVVSRYGAYRPEKINLALGDSIRLTANGKTLDRKHRVNNGAVYQVEGFTKDGDIRLSNGWVLGKDFRHMVHGYVVTSHASQGRTVDQVLVAMPASTLPAVGREAAYVSVSRGRLGATIYTDVVLPVDGKELGNVVRPGEDLLRHPAERAPTLLGAQHLPCEQQRDVPQPHDAQRLRRQRDRLASHREEGHPVQEKRGVDARRGLRPVAARGLRMPLRRVGIPEPLRPGRVPGAHQPQQQGRRPHGARPDLEADPGSDVI